MTSKPSPKPPIVRKVDAPDVRARLALFKEYGAIASYEHGPGTEKVTFFPPAPVVKELTAKELDDREKAQTARFEAWERRVSTAAAGGIRPTRLTPMMSREDEIRAATRRERERAMAEESDEG